MTTRDAWNNVHLKPRGVEISLDKCVPGMLTTLLIWHSFFYRMVRETTYSQACGITIYETYLKMLPIEKNGNINWQSRTSASKNGREAHSLCKISQRLKNSLSEYLREELTVNLTVQDCKHYSACDASRRIRAKNSRQGCKKRGWISLCYCYT